MRDPESRSNLSLALGAVGAFVVSPLLSWLLQGGQKAPMLSPAILVVISVAAAVLAAGHPVVRIAWGAIVFVVSLGIYIGVAIYLNE
jgi:hypothetical protein